MGLLDLGGLELFSSLSSVNTINKYPQFIVGVLSQAKNGDEQF
jgi:hypothetical protein